MNHVTIAMHRSTETGDWLLNVQGVTGDRWYRYRTEGDLREAARITKLSLEAGGARIQAEIVDNLKREASDE